MAAKDPYVGLQFELFVDDVAKSITFYTAVLGFTPPDDVDLDGYVTMTNGAVTIGLGRLADLSAEHHLRRAGLDAPRGVGIEIVLRVDDVDGAYAVAQAQAEALGGGIEALEDRTWGLRDFRVIDPDGYYLRVTSR